MPLEHLTIVVAKSARLEGLHENLRSVWKLTPENYLDLKAATDTPERRDNLLDRSASQLTTRLQIGRDDLGGEAHALHRAPRAHGRQTASRLYVLLSARTRHRAPCLKGH